jgi:hypothetical protein
MTWCAPLALATQDALTAVPADVVRPKWMTGVVLAGMLSLIPETFC